MPQSVRTTKGRCTALATLIHRSPCSRFDRRLPSIEFNTPHQAAVERHRKAIGEQKKHAAHLCECAGQPCMPTSAQYASRRSAAPRSTPEPEQHARTVSTPSLRISGVKNRLSECQTITRKNPAKRHSRDNQIMSGTHPRHVLESAFFNRTDWLVLPQSKPESGCAALPLGSF